MRGYIVKRGKSFAAVVYLGRDPQTGKERRKWYSHKTRRDAEAHLAQIVAQIQGGGVIPSTKLRLAEYLEQWLRDYATGAVAPATLRAYQDVVRLHLTPALGDIPLARLSPQSIQAFFSQKLQQGLSTTSVHKFYRVLRESLGHAVRWGLMGRNPAALVDPPRPRRQEMRVWDEEQVRLFLAEAKRSSPLYRLYLTALTTGMRQGELLGLRWQDLDLLLGVARVTQTFYRLCGRQIFKAPKTEKSRRTVALPPVLVQEILALGKEQEESRQMLGIMYKDHGLVFCQPDGKPLHAQNVTRRDFRKVIERAGLARIRFHDLRHCHATLLLQQGVHPKVVQERLGHSTPAFTLHVYSHVLPGMQEAAARALEARLFGTESKAGP